MIKWLKNLFACWHDWKVISVEPEPMSYDFIEHVRCKKCGKEKTRYWP